MKLCVFNDDLLKLEWNHTSFTDALKKRKMYTEKDSIKYTKSK